MTSFMNDPQKRQDPQIMFGVYAGFTNQRFEP
jgi:hypothetical protein